VTERLYYTDSYLASFSAAVSEHADGGRRVYLDRSAFYPTSGGQPHDLGTLNGIPVFDVVDDGERVAHLLAAPLAMTSVEGLVDWPRRFDHMQQHTGQHLLSAVFIELLNAETASVHFGADSSTLDLDVGELSPGQVADVQDRANAVAAENRPVTVSLEDAATATGLRKPSERAGMLRLVSIAELDKSACGGTHVRATSEIGSILIRRVERVKKRVRVDFVCGLRAARRARADYLALSHVATGFSAALDDVPALVDRQRIDLRDAHAARDSLVRELATYQARDRIAVTAPNGSGRRVVTELISGGPLDALRPLALAVASEDGAIFIGALDDPASIMLATSPSSGVDAGAVLKELLAASGGRGGGSARLAQGSLPSKEALMHTIAALGAIFS
jgi:alanyl-tRNA synthetase